MKKIIVLIFMTCFACQQSKVSNKCLSVERERDSLSKLNEIYENMPIFKFYNILSREKGTASDSILINDYNDLEGKDSLLNLYVWDRINTINQNITKINGYREFQGTYLLKHNHNKKYAQLTKVKVENDSCYLFKYGNIVHRDRFNLINSSDKLVKGKLRINQYKIRFLNFASTVVLIIDNNLCMDCEQLQFYKVKS